MQSSSPAYDPPRGDHAPRDAEAELADLRELEPWLVAELQRGSYRYCDFSGRLDPPTDEGFDG